MSKKIKEIRKIESPIKEIKKEKKVLSLDDEVYEESKTEKSVDNLRDMGRVNENPTLKTEEVLQDTAIRERRVSTEDEQEISFRPTYMAPGRENQNAYSPVSAPESSGRTKVFGEEGRIERRNDLQPQQDPDPQKRGEMEGGREYIDEANQKRERRKTM